METTFKLAEKVNGFFTELAGKSIPGKVVKVKAHTGIIVCEFPIKGRRIIEEHFTLEGVSIRGKEYGYITPRVIETPVIVPKSDQIGEEIANLIKEALTAFRSDDRNGFVAAQTKLAILGGVNPHGAVDLAGIITDFCKSGDEEPSPETMQAIRACLHK